MSDRRVKAADVALCVAAAVAVVAAIVFGIPGIIGYGDSRVERLVTDTVTRAAVCVQLVMLLLRSDESKAYLTVRRGWGKALLWSIPCFAVAIVNFPFSAMIRGAATVTRVDLLWLFLLKCASIALLEELFFRALVVPLAKSRIGGRYATLWAVLLSAAVFGLMHIINLFFGAGIGATLLQVGYTFLIGCMLAVMLLKTGNVWLCVITHFVFDVGGMIITDLGRGLFQDTAFRISTAVVGVLATAYVIATVVCLVRKECAEKKREADAEDAENRNGGSEHE